MTFLRWIDTLEAMTPLSDQPCVWLVETRSDAAQAAAASVRATPTDLEDAARWRDPQRGAARLVRRRLLRVLAARVLGCCASTVEIGRDAGGRSTVIAPRRLFASVARHGSWAALAVAANPVGVDLEHASPAAPLPLDVLPSAVCRWVGENPNSPNRFAHAWTALEAYAKALGLGVGDVLRDGVAEASECRVDGPVFPQASLDLRFTAGLCAAVVLLDRGAQNTFSAGTRFGRRVEAA